MARTMYVFFFLAFAAVSWAVPSCSLPEKEAEITRKCAQDNGIDPQMPELDMTSKDVQCALKCILEQGNYVDESGKILVEAFKQYDIKIGKVNEEESYECLQKLPDIKNCEDVVPIDMCREWSTKYLGN
uniref:Odorant-binding protein 7 n=1 Tax=Dastarcus helophoroides TaxID=1169899 RepID=A0A1I9HZP5_9CUCU|nr:odorant-binding protein 7 [Dastarcus helophoroides]